MEVWVKLNTEYTTQIPEISFEELYEKRKGQGGVTVFGISLLTGAFCAFLVGGTSFSIGVSFIIGFLVVFISLSLAVIFDRTPQYEQHPIVANPEMVQAPSWRIIDTNFAGRGVSLVEIPEPPESVSLLYKTDEPKPRSRPIFFYGAPGTGHSRSMENWLKGSLIRGSSMRSILSPVDFHYCSGGTSDPAREKLEDLVCNWDYIPQRERAERIQQIISLEENQRPERTDR